MRLTVICDVGNMTHGYKKVAEEIVIYVEDPEAILLGKMR